MKYFNISDQDAVKIAAESLTFRKYQFQTVANTIVEHALFRDNKIAAIKLLRTVISAVGDTPSLVDCKNAIENAIHDYKPWQ